MTRHYRDPAKAIEERSIPEPNSGCHIWLGACVSHGYGIVRNGGKNWLAHRLAWSLRNGAIPDGMHVLHRCDCPWCVNVDHLFLGSRKDNMQDMKKKGRGRPPKGEEHVRAVLTEADVFAIRSSPLMESEIAEIYGVHRATIGNIRRNETWRHLL